MAANEKRGVTVKIDAELHAEVKKYIEERGITMGDFVTLALQDELHPKLNMQEEKTMGNMRTLAFQVPEELFQQIKDYLQRNNMTQKEFVIGLIETEINRDLTQRAIVSETQTDIGKTAEEHAETVAASDCESVAEEVREYDEEQRNGDFSDDFGSESEDLETDEDQDESEGMGMSMGL